ncbi:MAG TPA: hypothetical protein DHV53_00850 [Gammaproteobacteria bacterium]|uniref:Uncharacterized protein n=1 Tax=OM182 bacterium TaxID=2510334 RepID=A0A520S0S7_9GAMM|nr:hypothetical protein [Gammaproteobacteria bacterium]RZO76058.1 MAG: hypothetical protein EVA69_03450 [OM182 bacterium]HAR90041.1 hypothetical protein [Gammaproteobacteria bacterium]HBJ90233.1 hypothetical protein [Gammaproteobacteria bacterium]HCI87173.1 hypothetical protein [Gammaproteobacteria bacterium]|tara:strand:- start:575 stop:1159 length:585 start_codon:yes stop_codon:yes gene_type:complete
MKSLKIGLLVIGLLLLGTLLTLRVTGFPPGHPTAGDYVNAGRSARPGLWLAGEVVSEAVTNWDWVNQYSDAFAEDATELETRTWYGIPHSVTVLLVPRGDKLYLQSSAQTFRLNKEFPYGKVWWRNVERDPRVRLKIGGKIYEMTVVLVQDRAEVAQLRGGKDPIVKALDANGNEYITEEWHYWRVFQRNIAEY